MQRSVFTVQAAQSCPTSLSAVLPGYPPHTSVTSFGASGGKSGTTPGAVATGQAGGPFGGHAKGGSDTLTF